MLLKLLNHHPSLLPPFRHVITQTHVAPIRRCLHVAMTTTDLNFRDFCLRLDFVLHILHFFSTS